MGPRGVPLAWNNLAHEPSRFLWSVAGISFAVLLMLMQIGFLNAMFDGQVELIQKLNADLFITNKLKYTMAVQEPFPRRRLYQATSLPGVEAAFPVYVDILSGLWKNPEDQSIRPIRVIGFNPEDPVFLDETIRHFSSQLNQPDTCLFDLMADRTLGIFGPGTETELSGRSIRVVGTFALGTDFANDGTLIMSDLNYGRFLPGGSQLQNQLGRVELGLVKIDNSREKQEVQRELRTLLPGDVDVLSKNEFIANERAFWRSKTPIGYVFSLGTILGFLVGTIICYQVLYSGITKYLPQFATLKALGYQNRVLLAIVSQQALCLAALGFFPGLALGQVLYWWVADATGLPMRLTLLRTLLVFLLTVPMCLISGTLAVRRAFRTDPAELF